MNNAIIIYSLLSFLILFLCGKVSYKLNLLDYPNKRKIHSRPTSYMGGFAISVILLFSILLRVCWNLISVGMPSLETYLV